VSVSTQLEPTTDFDRRITLLDLVDRLVGKGVVIRGDITLAIADIDLIYISLRALISSVSTLEERESEAR
jgi:gas vesicle protein GvpA/GvpJ/GvpM family